MLVLFEGWGASGKGSTIGKVIKNIDPRFFKVATCLHQQKRELRKPFLYRYMKEIPEEGKFTFPGFRMDGTDLQGSFWTRNLEGDDYVKRMKVSADLNDS